MFFSIHFDMHFIINSNTLWYNRIVVASVIKFPGDQMFNDYVPTIIYDFQRPLFHFCTGGDGEQGPAGDQGESISQSDSWRYKVG
jgi:hypothetical protein